MTAQGQSAEDFFHSESAPSPPIKPIAILAGMAGNLMEWYDFALYGVLAPTLGSLFFPQSNHLLSILSVFGVFAAGYIMRLVGGAFFGHLADHHGRRKALMLSAILMAVSTALVGILPVYVTVGILSPLLFTIFRLVQGLSVGGEFITSVTYLLENAPPTSRALYGGLAMSSAGGGILLGTAVGTVLFSIFTREQVLEWAWRLPFLASIPLGLSIAVLRLCLPEEKVPAPHAGSRQRSSSLLHSLAEHPMVILKGALGGWSSQSGFYIMAIFLSSYLVTGHLFSEATSLGMQTASVGLVVLMAPCAGFLADRFGRKPMVLISATCCLLMAWPLFKIVNWGHNTSALFVMLAFALMISIGITPYQIWLAERFPRSLRASSLGLSYNISAGVLGGMTPLICISLIALTHNRMAPVLLIIVSTLATVLFSLSEKETGDQPLK